MTVQSMSQEDPAEYSGPSCPSCRDKAENINGNSKIESYDRDELCPDCADEWDNYNQEDAYDGSKTPQDRANDPARRSNYDPRTRSN